MSCPSIWATLSLLINILLGSFQLFLHVSQPLSEGEIIPFSGVCQSGESCIIHAGGDGGFTRLTDCFDNTTTTTSGNIITQASFSALASANSFVYFCIERSNITLTHLHVSNCRVHSLVLWHFVAGYAG